MKLTLEQKARLLIDGEFFVTNDGRTFGPEVFEIMKRRNTMGWLNTRVHFPEHRLILTISARQGRAAKDIQVLLEKNLGPEIEGELRRIIVAARPSLENCEILWMDFNPDVFQWEIGVTHPSLPVCAMFSEAKREPLFVETVA